MQFNNTEEIMAKSLYETLGVSDNASAAEIKKAYRQLARQYHPDRNSDPKAQDKFKEINAAYEVLSDTEKKQQYDQFGDSMFGGQNFHDFAQGQGAGVDLDDILRQMFGGAGGFGGFSQGAGGFGGQSGFGAGGQRYSQPDLDMTANITIPFMTSYMGGKHQVTGGEGEKFDIKIPAGIKSGETLRVKGKGESYQGQRGDLMIKVEVSSSPNYTRKGSNLYKDIEVPLKYAMFGGKIEVETPDKTITLKIPSGTKYQQNFRIKEKGFPDRKSGIKGDMFLVANIIIPKADDLPDDLRVMCESSLPE